MSRLHQHRCPPPPYTMSKHKLFRKERTIWFVNLDVISAFAYCSKPPDHDPARRPPVQAYLYRQPSWCRKPPSRTTWQWRCPHKQQRSNTVAQPTLKVGGEAPATPTPSGNVCTRLT